MALASGTRFGHYEIISPIGAGGMGEVYRARDTRLERTVAIKVLPYHLSCNPDSKQRFEREARAISSLNHPHICTLHDVGTQDGVSFLVMEYLDGETLSHRLQKGSLRMEQALKIGTEIADALQKAHDSGIIHRDLKPGNIMLTKTGAKLMDFGLAKPSQVVTEVACSATIATVSKALTTEGTIVGTLQYMSPEQLEGKEADVRSDIFALGAVLYEMFTGQQAFTGKSRASVIAAILTSEPPPISQLQPLSPTVLDHVIKRALAKDPDERWQTARDLASELRWIRECVSQLANAVVSAPRPRWRELVAWGIAALALAAAILMLRPTPSIHPELVKFQISAPEGVSLPNAIVSPDGRHLAILNDDGGQIWLRELDSTVVRLLPGTDGAGGVFWSPDSRYVAFTSGGKLHKLLIQNGSPETICDVSAGYAAGGSWGSQGTILFAVAETPGNEGIYLVPEQGGAPRKLSVHDESGAELEGYWPHFLPDGFHFLFVGGLLGTTKYWAGSETRSEKPKIYLADVTSGTSRRVRLTDSRAAFAAPGYLLFVIEGTLFAQAFDVNTAELVGDPTPVAERVRYFQPTGFAAFSVSQNGVVAYRTKGALVRLVWYDRAGKELQDAGEPGEYEPSSFRLSPDGRRLAISATDPISGTLTQDIWIIDLARRTGFRFTTNLGDEFAPIWSPDGRRIVFSADWKAVPNLYEQKVESDAAETLLAATGKIQVASDWSRDGRWILFVQREPGGLFEISALPVFGERKPVRITRIPSFGSQPRVSPDGRWVIYDSNGSGRSEIYLQAFQGSTEKNRVSTDGGSQPRWRGDGKELFYLANDGRLFGVAVQSGAELTLGDSRPLFQPKSAILGFDVSADGQRFLIATSAGTPVQSTVILNWQAELKGR